MKEKIREIIEKSELAYTAAKIIDAESYEMMIEELIEKLEAISE